MYIEKAYGKTEITPKHSTPGYRAFQRHTKIMPSQVYLNNIMSDIAYVK